MLPGITGLAGFVYGSLNQNEILKYSPKVWLDGKNATNSTGDLIGQKLITWRDRSGNGYDVEQQNDSFRPDLNSNIVQFRANESLIGVGNPLSNGDNVVMVIVGRELSEGASGGSWVDMNRRGDTDHWTWVDNNLYSSWGRQNRQTFNVSAKDTTALAVWTFVTTSIEYSISYNATKYLGSTATTRFFDVTNWQVGRGIASHDIDLAEIIIFESSVNLPNLSEIEEIKDILYEKWNVDPNA